MPGCTTFIPGSRRAAAARLIRSDKRGTTFLSVFGPLSILILLCCGRSDWFWVSPSASALGTPLGDRQGETGLGVYAYFSGVTFFTLGYGDLTPSHPLGRFLAVLETGIGFGFLAVVIGYLPVLYQAFSRREVTISLLDARAGSPPTAATFLAGSRFSDRDLDHFLGEWERWAAEVLESHVSFPVLSYYRSQHDNQSWLAALTAILDTSALVLAAVPKTDRSQAWMAFAMGRHVVVDLAQVFHVPPIDPLADRLPPERWRALCEQLEKAGLGAQPGPDLVRAAVRGAPGMYELYVFAAVESRRAAWDGDALPRRGRAFGLPQFDNRSVQPHGGTWTWAPLQKRLWPSRSRCSIRPMVLWNS